MFNVAQPQRPAASVCCSTPNMRSLNATCVCVEVSPIAPVSVPMPTPVVLHAQPPIHPYQDIALLGFNRVSEYLEII